MFFFRVLYTPSQIRYMTQHQEAWRLYLIISNSTIKIKYAWDFPGGPVVKTLRFHCRGRGFDPWLGNQDPTCCMVWQEKEKPTNQPTNKKKIKYDLVFQSVKSDRNSCNRKNRRDSEYYSNYYIYK